MQYNSVSKANSVATSERRLAPEPQTKNCDKTPVQRPRLRLSGSLQAKHDGAERKAGDYTGTVGRKSSPEADRPAGDAQTIQRPPFPEPRDSDTPDQSL